VKLIVNHEEHLLILKALNDTGASSSIIPEAYISVPFIKTDDSNKTKTTWITIGGKFTINKTRMLL
jgi:hypothetical protein